MAWKSSIRNEEITKSDPGATMRSRSRRRQRSDRPRIRDRKGGYTYLSLSGRWRGIRGWRRGLARYWKTTGSPYMPTEMTMAAASNRHLGHHRPFVMVRCRSHRHGKVPHPRAPALGKRKRQQRSASGGVCALGRERTKRRR